MAKKIKEVLDFLRESPLEKGISVYTEDNGAYKAASMYSGSVIQCSGGSISVIEGKCIRSGLSPHFTGTALWEVGGGGFIFEHATVLGKNSIFSGDFLEDYCFISQDDVDLLHTIHPWTKEAFREVYEACLLIKCSLSGGTSAG